MSATRPLPDAAARRRAVTDFDCNLAVSAAAGTGKTSLLVERLLNAVASGRHPLESMAAVTFTRKAAAEMRARLGAALEWLWILSRGGGGGGAGDPGWREASSAWEWLRGETGAPPREVARRALEALETLDRFDASTLHHFCAEILRLHPFEAGVDPAFSIDEGERFEETFEREWRRFLEEELGAPAGERAAAWRAALRLYSLEEMRQTARSLCAFDLPPPEEWRERCPEPRAALQEPLLRLLEDLRPVFEARLSFNPNFVPWVRGLADLAQAFIEGRWRGAGEPPPPGVPAGVLEQDPAAGKRALEEDAQRARAFKERALRLRDALRQIAALEEGAALALLEPLRPLVRRAREAHLRDGRVTQDGLLTLARDLLRDHPRARRSLQERFRHILVDEFQDTDPVQYEILFFLAERRDAPPARDAWKAELEPGRLFIVGDPKQSIYRFRKADIAACRRAVERVREQGGALLSLSANFRSRPALIEAVNRLFAPEFPACPAEAQPPYEAMEAVREESEGPAVEIWSRAAAASAAEPPAERAEERRLREAASIAAWIAAHAGEGRAYRLREVAILLRSRTDLRIYLDALRASGVPFVVEGAREILERLEVRHLRALLGCLARPHDEVALLALLRSPLGGASDRDLLQHARAGGRWNLLRPPPAGSPEPVRRRLEWLRELRRSLLDRPAEEQAMRALEASGLELIEAAQEDGAQRVANLRRYALAVAEVARERGLSLERAMQAVDRRAELEDAGIEESPLADETLEAVRVLTVHKAKGMEFDVVVLPDLLRGVQRDRREPIEIVRPRGPEGGLGVRTRRGANAWWVRHLLEEERHAEAEELRAFYVACTRARRRLIVMGGPAKEAEARRCWPRALRHWGYDAGPARQDPGGLPPLAVHRTVEGGGGAPLEEPPPPPVDEAVRRFDESSARARAQEGERERFPSGSKERQWERLDREDAGRAAAEGAPGRAAARDAAPGAVAGGSSGPALSLGRVVHRALERWDGTGDGRALLAREVEREAREEGVEPGPLAREAGILWEQVVSSDLPEILRQVGPEGREVPVLLEEGGVVWRGSLDLLYRAGEGSWTVLDYKTEDPGPDPGASALRHVPQMRVYARAVARVLGGEPRAEIFWVRTGRRTLMRAEDLAGPLG
jgi:ATP-dependent helicase/nuclease subunit A